MAHYFISGPLLNALGRMATAATPLPAAHLEYPVSYLYDGIAGLAFRFNSSTSDPSVKFDLNILDNGGFETALTTTATTGWLSAAGTTMTRSTEYASTSNSGSTYSLRLQGTTYHDVQIRPNEALKFEWAVLDSVNSSMVYAQIECMDLGKYLTSTGGWSTASTTYVVSTTAGGAWNTGSLTFVSPSLADLLQDTATLRVTLYAASTYAYFDDVVLYPGVSWASAHGHNWTPAVSPLVYGSSDDSMYTLVDTLDLHRDVALATFSTSYYRYWKFVLSGVPFATPYCGEIVLGQYDTLLENPKYGSSVAYLEKQTRRESPAGGEFVLNRGGQPVRMLNFTFYYSDSTQYYQSRRSVLRASRGGENMIALAATELDSDQIVYGRITESASYTKSEGVFWSCSYDLIEDALPVMDPVYPTPAFTCPSLTDLIGTVYCQDISTTETKAGVTVTLWIKNSTGSFYEYASQITSSAGTYEFREIPALDEGLWDSESEGKWAYQIYWTWIYDYGPYTDYPDINIETTMDLPVTCNI
jgi:hypothetical protein